MELSTLPPQRLLDVPHFIEALDQQELVPAKLHDAAGLPAWTETDLTLNDFKQTRREPWKGFARELRRD